MRRGFASMLMGLSLVMATCGWAGLVFAHSVLDDQRSGRLSDELMGHGSVRAVLVNRLGEGMERYVPVDEPMSRQELRAVAAVALEDRAAAAAIRDAVSEAHRLGLADAEAELVFTHFDVNEAARHALLAARPSLEGRILVNPPVKVRLPVEGLTWFSGLKALADRFAVIALAVAAVGFATSFVIAAEPTPVLRRAAWWILTSAAGWMAVGPGFAAIVRFSAPSSYIVAAVTLETFLRSMQDPAVIMASFGIGLLSVSYLAPAIARRRGALLVERARRRLAHADRGANRPSAEPVEPSGTAVVGTTVIGPLPATSSTANSDKERVGRGRLSAAWKEGHGYLDDARVAPFFSRPTNES